MIVDSNAPAPLKYTDPTFQALLFVRANIYDTSGVSPSLASTVNLALLDNGVYWGKFTFTAGKTYLVQKLVYTDGTYTTVDQTFAQDNDDVQCIDLKTANIDVLVSSRNSTAHFDAVIGTPAGASIAADLAEIEGETDALTTAVAAIPTTPVLTAHFDTVIGSPAGASIAADLAEIESETDGIAAIPTNPLLASSYTAPDNAGIAAIKAKTDNLPADPASNTQVNTRVATTHFDTVIGTPAGASIAADLAEIEGETDGIAAIPTNPLLTTDVRLNHLDVDVSSRLATAGYTAPDNADIVAIKAKTDNLPADPTSTTTIMTALSAVDADVLTRVSTNHFDGVIGVPAGASIAADIAEVEAETDGIAALETDAAAATRTATILAAIGGATSVAVVVEDVVAELDEQNDISGEIDESNDL